MQQRGNLRLVGLELRVGAPDRRVLIRRVLQLDQAQRQPVDEDHDVRPPVVLPLDHRELVHRQPVVRPHVAEIHQPHMIARDAAIGPRIFHRHAIAQHPVKGAVGLRRAKASPPAAPCATPPPAPPREWPGSAAGSPRASAPPAPPRQTNPAPPPVHRARGAARARPHSPAPRTIRGRRLRRWIR